MACGGGLGSPRPPPPCARGVRLMRGRLVDVCVRPVSWRGGGPAQSLHCGAWLCSRAPSSCYYCAVVPRALPPLDSSPCAPGADVAVSSTPWVVYSFNIRSLSRGRMSAGRPGGLFWCAPVACGSAVGPPAGSAGRSFAWFSLLSSSVGSVGWSTSCCGCLRPPPDRLLRSEFRD